MNAATPPPRLTVYTRDGCGLCEEMIAGLAELIGTRGLPVEVLDVDADESARARYGLKVPVLLVDGVPVCSGRLDPGLVEDLIAR